MSAPLPSVTRLTGLALGRTGIRDLAGLHDVPALAERDLRSCGRLSSLKDIDSLTGLTDLALEGCPRPTTLEGRGVTVTSG
ncbi:hypothetical protein ACIF80_01610 [Streptomyces sp. NPDC085927]|uniref:hypothetical protein n=1 Tax=Streptomyces sp. NPDC085927 TaxID=3365738 RepID=UPI0037D905DA